LTRLEWDPVSTLRRTLWISGAQWAGKSTVATILAGRHGLTCYHYDVHDARGHQDRRLAAMVRRGETPADVDWEAYWTGLTPREQADRAIASFAERFTWVQDDLRALLSARPILAEGWGLRPELVLPVAGSAGQLVVLVPTEEFRQEQLARTERAGAVAHRLSDPALAQRNRIERDRLVAADLVAQARRLEVRVIEVDGTRDADGVADLVADHFAPYLP